MFVDMTLINPAAPNRRLRPGELIGSMVAFSALLTFVVRVGVYVAKESSHGDNFESEATGQS